MSIFAKLVLGVTVFTAIELVGLAVWLIGSGVHITPTGQIGLAIILFGEHFVSVLVGTNLLSSRPLFSIPSASP